MVAMYDEPWRRPGRIAVKCVGGAMNGRYISVGPGTTFYRATTQKGVDSYRLLKIDVGQYIMALEPRYARRVTPFHP